jgi:hypothetical protein
MAMLLQALIEAASHQRLPHFMIWLKRCYDKNQQRK